MLVGYSDHTVGIGAAAFAIPMGAKVVEKHFTLDKSLEGPDHKASLSPAELKEFVRIVRKVDAFMGTTIKKPNLSEVYTRKAMQRNMVALRNLNTGDIITEDVIIAKRTNGLGLSPIYYKEIIGRQLIKDIKSDHIFDIKDFKEL